MSRLRIRTLKPELWRDEAVGSASRDARLLFIGLITMADDAGRMRVALAAIVGHVYPYDEDVTAAKVRKWLAELERVGLIETYEHDGREYLWLTGWPANQKVNRATASKLPCPPNPNGSWWPHDGLTEEVVSRSLNGSGVDH